jgi:hypothetical protein
MVKRLGLAGDDQQRVLLVRRRAIGVDVNSDRAATSRLKATPRGSHWTCKTHYRMWTSRPRVQTRAKRDDEKGNQGAG